MSVRTVKFIMKGLAKIDIPQNIHTRDPSDFLSSPCFDNSRSLLSMLASKNCVSFPISECDQKIAPGDCEEKSLLQGEHFSCEQ